MELLPPLRFLSIQAQDFIEESAGITPDSNVTFLSIQAQDFIEDVRDELGRQRLALFLSIQAQDFIEESAQP